MPSIRRSLPWLLVGAGLSHFSGWVPNSTVIAVALRDSFRTSERVVFVDVPTQGRSTLYGLVGDWVPMVPVVGLLALVATAIRLPAWRGARCG